MIRTRIPSLDSEEAFAEVVVVSEGIGDFDASPKLQGRERERRREIEPKREMVGGARFGRGNVTPNLSPSLLSKLKLNVAGIVGWMQKWAGRPI